MTPLLCHAGLGMTSVAVNMVTLTYYTVLVSFPVLFLAYSFTWDLPWDSCENSWNSANCTIVCMIDLHQYFFSSRINQVKNLTKEKYELYLLQYFPEQPFIYKMYFFFSISLFICTFLYYSPICL